MTQAAVSHQIRSLEQYLGLKLFRRLHRSLRLTDAGQAYLPAVSRSFDELHNATRRLEDAERRGPVTISVLPSFAAGWLVPRLGRFRQAWPDVELRIDPYGELVDLSRGDVDIGIRYGRGEYPGPTSDRLMQENIFPVCSPTLVTGPGAIREPTDLAHHNLLHDDGHGDWRTWLLAAGVNEVDPARGTVFTDASMLIQAAMSGQGVAQWHLLKPKVFD